MGLTSTLSYFDGYISYGHRSWGLFALSLPVSFIIIRIITIDYIYFGKNGSSNFRTFKISEENVHICWFSVLSVFLRHLYLKNYEESIHIFFGFHLWFRIILYYLVDCWNISYHRFHMTLFCFVLIDCRRFVNCGEMSLYLPTFGTKLISLINGFQRIHT